MEHRSHEATLRIVRENPDALHHLMDHARTLRSRAVKNALKALMAQLRAAIAGRIARMGARRSPERC